MNRNTIRREYQRSLTSHNNIFTFKRIKFNLIENGNIKSVMTYIKTNTINKVCRCINSKFGEIGRMAVAADRFTINELIGLGPDESTIRFRCQQQINLLEFNKEMNDESYYKECGLY